MKWNRRAPAEQQVCGSNQHDGLFVIVLNFLFGGQGHVKRKPIDMRMSMKAGDDDGEKIPIGLLPDNTSYPHRSTSLSDLIN
jgi:hypothetical protein